DEHANRSSPSNDATGTTLDAPRIGVAPESLSADLLTGEKTTRLVTISNSGTSELRFDIRILPESGTPALARNARVVIVPAPGSAADSPPGSASWPASFHPENLATVASGSYSAGHAPGRREI